MKTPERLRDALRRRADLYALIRRFFAERDVLEVETPILSASANTDPNIQSFSTRFRDNDVRWLRTSSEFAQKRLLAAGIGDCYELGRVFRDGEAGRRHNPEFTMLEWYRVGRDHRWIADEAVELIRILLDSVNKTGRLKTYTYRELFQSTVSVDPFDATEESLQAALGDVRIGPRGLTRDDWLDLLLTHRIQPKLPADQITVVFEYPAAQCALARIRDGVAERFEIYVGSQELANGYHELTDAAEQLARFENDNLRRRKKSQLSMPIDEHFLEALKNGLPPCSGVALGVDRLLMAMSDADSIADVLSIGFGCA